MEGTIGASSGLGDLDLAVEALKLQFSLDPGQFEKAYPKFKDGSHKRIRKITDEERYLFAHALRPDNNASVSTELESYERFNQAGLRTARVSGLITVPSSATCGLRGLKGFLVEFIEGVRIKPLENALRNCTGEKNMDLLWSRSALLSKINKVGDHRAVIEDLKKLYEYSKKNGIYDFQGIYNAPHFTLIDPPQPAGPRAEHTQKLCWLMQMLNAKSTFKAELPKDCA